LALIFEALIIVIVMDFAVKEECERFDVVSFMLGSYVVISLHFICEFEKMRVCDCRWDFKNLQTNLKKRRKVLSDCVERSKHL
jgi:hypothetical protein